MRKIPIVGYQQHLLHKDLLDQLNPNEPLLMLSRRIDWDSIEKKLAPLYAELGRPAKPVRLMVGLMMLKQLKNLSDERVVEEWMQNPYHQAFCGARRFQWQTPCNPSDLTYFRKRIGEGGADEIFKLSVLVHGEAALEEEVVIDTTVQEKNITYPTDTKLQNKIIAKCRVIAKREGIQLRRSFKKEQASILLILRFDKSPKTAKKRARARKRLKTITLAVFRDVERKLHGKNIHTHDEDLQMFCKVLSQKKDSKKKIYSFHEPQVQCIAKGKAHKKYEFGTKAAIAMTKKSVIIVGVKSFVGNPYDGDTLLNTLESVKNSTDKEPLRALCDRGYKGRPMIGATKICMPQRSTSRTNRKARKKGHKDYCRRSAIEPVIGHVKSDHRMARCYLKGSLGDAINLQMAACAFNLKKWMRIAMEYLRKGVVRHFFVFYALLRLVRGLLPKDRAWGEV